MEALGDPHGHPQVVEDLKAEGNEVAIETIEIAHEGLAIANG